MAGCRVILDLRTIFVTGAATCFILGAMQLMAFATGRFTCWPGWWGLSTLFIGAGLLAASLRDIIPDTLSIELGNSLVVGGSLLLVVGVRAFAGKEPYWQSVVIGVAFTWIMLSLWPGAAGFNTRVVVMALILAGCDLAMVREAFDLARRQKLRSAWILAGLFLPTAILFLGRTGVALSWGVGTTLFPVDAGVHGWLAAIGVSFMVLRGNALLLMAIERSNVMLAALARRDPLTGAMNRSGLEQWLAQMAAGSRHPALRVSLLLIDIDHFKTLNDTLGHAAGDEVLRLLTETVHSQIRSTDSLARQGGDEFAVVLPSVGVREAVRVAERIRQAFRQALADRHDIAPQPTLSIGIAEGDVSTQPLDELMSQADEALYRSKRLGRDRVQAQLSSVDA